jgi:hypothetical protein
MDAIPTHINHIELVLLLLLLLHHEMQFLNPGGHGGYCYTTTA